MNIKRLCEMQKILDERIVREHSLEGKNIAENKVLALLVEISELANETRCFKHWSTKGASENQVLLEEYVDSLHFFLSIANDYEYDVDRLLEIYTNELKQAGEERTLVASFILVTEKIVMMNKEKDAYHYINAFVAYLELGTRLGFTPEEIEQAYIRKNEINHQRQDNGY
ncbi:dUTP diphosphatase [Bacillus tuaregi]|uniref:dUTP diphosphatase n=1 Tax=Bacillus tuaregi TaxID=1816695 RepID=UPI0008F8AD22|nr:dUTP diphosphatase [Bacillus tuaregi]